MSGSGPVFDTIVPWILCVLMWPLLTWIATAKPLSTFHCFLAGIFFAALYGPAKCGNGEIGGWFLWMKTPSLLSGWFTLLAASARPGSDFVSIVWMWVLFANVMEAGVLGLTDNDWVCGVPLVLVSPLAPGGIVDACGIMRVPEKRFVLGIKYLRNRLPPKWYFRLYCITLGTYALVGKYWETDGSIKIYLTCSCFVPLVWMDLVDRRKQEMQRIFLIRVFALLLMFIDLLMNDDFNNVTSKGTDFKIPVAERNILAAVIMLSLVGACWSLDRLEASLFGDSEQDLGLDVRSALLRLPRIAQFLGLSPSVPTILQKVHSPCNGHGQDHHDELVHGEEVTV